MHYAMQIKSKQNIDMSFLYRDTRRNMKMRQSIIVSYFRLFAYET